MNNTTAHTAEFKALELSPLSNASFSNQQGFANTVDAHAESALHAPEQVQQAGIGGVLLVAGMAALAVKLFKSINFAASNLRPSEQSTATTRIEPKIIHPLLQCAQNMEKDLKEKRERYDAEAAAWLKTIQHENPHRAFERGLDVLRKYPLSEDVYSFLAGKEVESREINYETGKKSHVISYDPTGYRWMAFQKALFDGGAIARTTPENTPLLKTWTNLGMQISKEITDPRPHLMREYLQWLPIFVAANRERIAEDDAVGKAYDAYHQATSQSS